MDGLIVNPRRILIRRHLAHDLKPQNRRGRRMTLRDREKMAAVCRERDVYKNALELIAATDRRKVAMLGPLAVADAVNIAKNALRQSQEGRKE